MKFDCVKFTGKIEYVRLMNSLSGGQKVKVSLNGSVIPNLQVSNKLYEELADGEVATLYGIFNKSSKKDKNYGVLYGLETQGGVKIFDTQQRFKAPIAFAGFAAIAFCMMFVVGWVPSLFALGLMFGPNPNVFYNATVLTTVEASLVALFFLWRARVMLSATKNPESWMAIEPSALSSRFSKLHK